jgi:hypothetical protein
MGALALGAAVALCTVTAALVDSAAWSVEVELLATADTNGTERSC